MRNTKYKAVIFDLDGTLLDTIRDIAEAMNVVLLRLGFPDHPVEAYKGFVGEGMEVLVRRALPAGRREPATVNQGLAEVRKEYARRWRRNSRPYAGVPQMLDALAAGGLRMAVLSNKPDDFAKIMVAALLPRWPLQPVLGTRPGVPRKPDPAGALEIAGGLGLAPREFLYVGDTATDMQTAKGAGMFPVGVLWGFRTKEELAGAGAGAIIGRPEELPAILG